VSALQSSASSLPGQGVPSGMRLVGGDIAPLNGASVGYGFARVSNAAIARRDLSDAAFRAWVALDQWTFRGEFPTNTQWARACGWFQPNGREATRRIQRVLAELVKLGLVKRVHGDGERAIHYRRGLEVASLLDCAAFPKSTTPASHSPAESTTPASHYYDTSVALSTTPASHSGEPPPIASLQTLQTIQTIDRSTERFEQGEGEEAQKPEAKPHPFPVAVEIHERLYEGMDGPIGSKDWIDWQDRYVGVARDLLAGRIDQADVDAALAKGRKAASRRRGAVFTGEIVKATERRTRPEVASMSPLAVAGWQRPDANALPPPVSRYDTPPRADRPAYDGMGLDDYLVMVERECERHAEHEAARAEWNARQERARAEREAKREAEGQAQVAAEAESKRQREAEKARQEAESKRQKEARAEAQATWKAMPQAEQQAMLTEIRHARNVSEKFTDAMIIPTAINQLTDRLAMATVAEGGAA
jgi:hypothetical protein